MWPFNKRAAVPPSPPPICLECEFCAVIGKDYSLRCVRPGLPRSFVTGKIETTYCNVERLDWESGDSCGPQGRYWQAIVR
jgi:hypothetical protein